MDLESNPGMLRRVFCLWGAGLITVNIGCVSSWMQGSQDASSTNPRREELREVLQSENRPRLIEQIGSHRMMHSSRLENVGLVTRLPGSGGTVRASQPREKLLNNMRRNDVPQPNKLLDDPATAMVIASVTVPPSARKGSLLDIAVELSKHAEATSLERGWLLETSLVEMSQLGGQVREGFDLAKGSGQIVTRAQITGSGDPADKCQGIVVGGARLLEDRQLGIGMDANYADAITMKAILPAINSRFTHFDGRRQEGIAIPKQDNYLELKIPSRYRYDPYHFANVVLQTSFNETPDQYAERIELLRSQLREPTTVRKACWQLEAIGEETIEILAAELSNPNPEIRFFVAHSLAYLNNARAAPVLGELAVQQPAFRAMCLTGLTILDDYSAADVLEDLLGAADAETRYGALLAIRERDRMNPLANGQPIGDVGSIVEVATGGPPMVAVSLSKTPEIVVFGSNPILSLPPFMYISERILLRAEANGQITVSHFEPNQEDRIVQTGSDLRGLLTAIAQVGGTYGDWVSFLRQCGAGGFLAEPVVMNPIPQAGRIYQRNESLELGSPVANSDSLTSSLAAFDQASGSPSLPTVDQGADFFDPKSSMGSSIDSSATNSKTTSSKVAWYNPFSWQN